MTINSVEVASQESAALLWHQQLAHASHKVLTYMAIKGTVRGLPVLPSLAPFCAGCCQGKQSRKPKPRMQSTRPASSSNAYHHSTRTKQPLELIHSDICRPFSDLLSGSRYMLSFTNDFSRFSWIYFLKRKSDTLLRFQQFKAMVELQSSHKLKAIRSDNGGEYISHAFIRFCDDSGILRQLTQTYTPHQNGVSERKNRTLLDKARCMAFSSGIPTHLWTEAVAAANHVTNRTSTRANGGLTPYEKLIGQAPSVSHLRVFGCRSFVLNTSPARQKWAHR